MAAINPALGLVELSAMEERLLDRYPFPGSLFINGAESFWTFHEE